MINALRRIVRRIMARVAAWLNKVFDGKLSPNVVTFVSLCGHFLVLWCIVAEYFYLAAGTLVVFGLLDTLDGELARLQKSDSAMGMVLDATTDRMKETLVLGGIAYYFALTQTPAWVFIAIVTLGGSLIVSYAKAKGETAIATSGKKHQEVNRVFSDGVMPYEVRMVLIVLGLLVPTWLPAVIAVLCIGVWITVIMRLQQISEHLS